MATLETVARNTMLQALIDSLQATGTALAYIQLQDATGSAVATLYMSSPDAFVSAASGTSTANAIASDTSAAGGTANTVVFFDGNSQKILTATLSTGTATDFTINDLAIPAGSEVKCTAITMTQPAS